jgi:predicted RNA-binding Zn-ribbon protein involved in translation (DUF1610 family)
VTRVEYRHTGWHCEKCGKEMIQASHEPSRLQPTLDSRQRIGRCDKCRAVRMFRRVNQM